jgi:ATP dependent DNA ligase domain
MRSNTTATGRSFGREGGGEVVRLFTRRGHDWTERYPAIAAAAAKLRAKSFTLDGEAVVAGADGVAMFDSLHRRHKPQTRCYMRSIFWNSTARISGKTMLCRPVG